MQLVNMIALNTGSEGLKLYIRCRWWRVQIQYNQHFEKTKSISSLKVGIEDKM